MEGESVSRSEFRQRLDTLIRKHGSAAALARATGCSDAAIRQWAAGKAEPTRERLVQLATGGGVSVGWLAAGEGPMEPGEIALSAAPRSGELVPIPRYDIAASAGPGAFVDREHVVDHVGFSPQWIRQVLGAEPARLVLITATGDSMEPTIRHGDLLLVDTAVQRVQDDAIYVVIASDDTLLVKRIQRFVLGGGVSVKSDNPAYPIQNDITAHDAARIRIAGRVRWIGRLI